jgi:glycerol-3-phosphate dehydrogenase (NAD(P)+)
MAEIFVLGAGGFGTALAVALAGAGHRAALWGRTPEKQAAIRSQRENARLLPGVEIPESVDVTDSLAGASRADFIFIATPSVGVREAARSIAALVRPDIAVICAAKGLEPVTLKPLLSVIAEEIPGCRPVVLSGPSHAEEVARKVPTALVAAGESLQAAEEVQSLTANTHIRIYTSGDALGVQLGGALKNVIAFAAGILDGMRLGDNTKAALMTRGLTEIARLGVAMGAHRETFAGLSGVGDLIVTCCSQHSRNRRCGMYVGEGMSVALAVEKVGMTVEGITATHCAHELSQRLGVEMPITAALAELISGRLTAREVLAGLLERPLKPESEAIWF